MKLGITTYCRIWNRTLIVNGREIFRGTGKESPSEFLEELYRVAGLNYPKFFKMDLLTKTGFIAAEFLLAGTGWAGDCPKRDMGLFLMNRESSLATDRLFQKTIGEEYFPSPSLFVYTLPNVMMGEIAIRHKIYGENTFLVSMTPDAGTLYEITSTTFEERGLEQAIVGWVSWKGEKCEVGMVLVEKGENGIGFTREKLLDILNFCE